MSIINLVINGESADPSILRENENFYLTHSSYSFYPGLLILHSKDLINWKPICRALNTYVGDVWAPDLIKSNNKYYIYFPAKGTNWVISADNIEGPWSEPIDLKVTAIDPGHIQDVKTNKRYLHFSDGYAASINNDGTKIVGDLTRIYDGFQYPKDWECEGFCLEAPKLNYKDGYYYLTVAEGGTAGPATSHMVVSARSKSPIGPFENSPYNPIVHTYSYDEKWHSKGHGTIFNDIDNNWWVIYHAYEKYQINHGRQTIIEGIKWTDDGWFILDDKNRVLKKQLKPNHSQSFKDKEPSLYWTTYKEMPSDRYSVTKDGLELKPSNSPIRPLTIVPYDYNYIVEVKVKIIEDAFPGLTLFYNDNFSTNIYYDGTNIVTSRSQMKYEESFTTNSEYIFLRLRKRENVISFFYSTDGLNWTKTHVSHEVSSYNHNVLGGFSSLRVGIFNCGKTPAIFEYFDYKELDV